MQWSNLFLIELKYNVLIRSSKIAQQLRYFIVGLLIFVLAFVSHLIFSLLSLWHIYIVIVLSLPIFLYIIKPFSPPFYGANAILLDNDGMIAIQSDTYFKISRQSKVYPWGCALVLIKSDNLRFCLDRLTDKGLSSSNFAVKMLNNVDLNDIYVDRPSVTQKTLHLVFKDSLDNVDFRRLARLVNNAR